MTDKERALATGAVGLTGRAPAGSATARRRWGWRQVELLEGVALMPVFHPDPHPIGARGLRRDPPLDSAGGRFNRHVGWGGLEQIGQRVAILIYRGNGVFVPPPVDRRGRGGRDGRGAVRDRDFVGVLGLPGTGGVVRSGLGHDGIAAREPRRLERALISLQQRLGVPPP